MRQIVQEKTSKQGNEDEAPAKFVIGCSKENFDDGADTEVQTHVVPPDGGWGWVVVAASFMCNAVVDGIILTAGMLFPRLREEFGSSNTQVAWISSQLGGFYLLVGPFVCSLANAFGFRTVCILGAIVAAVTCSISYYSSSIYFLYISFGIMGGTGLGLIYVPAVIAPGFYFERRRAFATGIAVCGSGIGTFVVSALNTQLLPLPDGGWRYIFLVYAGLSLTCMIYALAFRPLSASTGKTVKIQYDGEVTGTPLLLKINRERDQELNQFPSDLSKVAGYVRLPSKGTIDDTATCTNGELKVPDVNPFPRPLLDRPPGAMAKRLSVPGVLLSNPTTTTIPEEEDIDTETKTLTAVPKINSEMTSSIPTSGSQKRLDNNKNGTKTIQNSLAPPGVRRASAQEKYPRVESAPVLSILRHSVDLQRRPSKQLIIETSRPFYRDDIFYSGSLARLPQYKSSETVSQYHSSVTRIPAEIREELDGKKENYGGLMNAATHVLKTMFDFSLLSSVTFIVLSVTGFMALLALFVPFSFVPSYTVAIGFDQKDAGFIMSLIGIFNTIGRIVAGLLSDHPKVDALFVNNIALIIGGAATICLPFLKTLPLLYGYAVVFGLSAAAFASLRSILLVELLGLDKLTNAFGLLNLFQGIAALFGAPIAGALVDATQEYNLSFYVFGGLFALSGILCIPLRRIKNWEDDRIAEKLCKEKYGVE